MALHPFRLLCQVAKNKTVSRSIPPPRYMALEFYHDWHLIEFAPLFRTQVDIFELGLALISPAPTFVSAPNHLPLARTGTL